ADPDADPTTATRALTAAALERLQANLAAADAPRLAFLTAGAMAVGEGESPDPAAAAIWGLIRSAQSEHPGRFALIDTDRTDASEAAMPAALALGAEEPQLALRGGLALAPRLTRVGAGSEEEDVISPIDPERTVLIT